MTILEMFITKDSCTPTTFNGVIITEDALHLVCDLHGPICKGATNKLYGTRCRGCFDDAIRGTYEPKLCTLCPK